MVIVSTIISTILGVSLVSTNAAEVPNISQSKTTTQANVINLESPIGTTETKTYLSDKTKFKNLKSASLTAIIQTKNHIIPLQLEFDLDNPDSITQKYSNAKSELIKSIRESQKNLIPKNQKFDRQKILSAFDVTVPVSQDPKVQTYQKPTLKESELQFYENNGYLPPIEVNESEIKTKMKELGMPDNYPIPHLDQTMKGKFNNAKQEDRLASMTESEKSEYQSRQEEFKIQEEIITQTTEQELSAIEQNPELQIKSIHYLTDNTDVSIKDLSIRSKKPILSQLTKADINKASRNTNSNPIQSQNSNQSTKLEDNIKPIATQDITSMFQVSEAEKQISKTQAKKDLEVYKSRTIKSAKEGNPQQHSQMEADMYKKEGVGVEELGAEIIGEKGESLTKQKNSKKVSSVDIESILQLGSISANAKGLNNSNNSLIIYNADAQNMAITADSQSTGQTLRIKQKYGYYNSQRWCFDNNSNRVYQSTGSNCTGIVENQTKCIDNNGSNSAGGIIVIWPCYGGTTQKYVFDEQGRLASKDRPDLCVDNYSSNQEGGTMVLWGCYNGSTQKYRAGYDNFGSNMGMTMRVTDQGGITSGYFGGHAYVEFWNSNGTHNTFSRWGNPTNYKDYDCSNNYRQNNIFDYDAISVDHPYDINLFTQGYKAYGIYMHKVDWDFIVFGSGYRNNYMNCNQVDIGGSGTYDWLSSKSREASYPATYGAGQSFPDTRYICSGYSIKLWNAYRGSNIYLNSNYYNLYYPFTPIVIYNQI